jgi:ferredoxin
VHGGTGSINVTTIGAVRGPGGFPKGSAVRATIDSTKCSGHARCAVTAPDVYDLDDDGYGIAYPSELPAELEDQAREGGEACPERAIAVQ